MTRRITVSVSDELYAALVAEAKRDFRDLTGQVRYKLALPTSSATLLLDDTKAAQSHPTAAQSDSTLLVDEPDVEDLLIAADEMDASGELMRKSSPAAKRRKAQIEALQKAWGQLFPKQPPLTETMAKNYLVATNNEASEVYFAMQKTKERNPGSPPTYVLGILRKDRETDARMDAIATAPTVVTVQKRDQGDLTNWRWTALTPEQEEDNRKVRRWAWEHARPGTDDREVWTREYMLDLYPDGNFPKRGSAGPVPSPLDELGGAA
jgi:hypothetical protein